MKIQTILLISIFLTVILACSASALVIQSVTTSPNNLMPGDVATIDILIKNDGSNDITDFSASLDLTNVAFAPYNSGTDYSIDEILEGKTKEVEFRVVALNNAVSGTYKIPVNINYKDDDVPKTKQSLIGISINTQPIIEASIEDGTLLKGKENKVSFKVVNKGLGNAKFLEITIGSSSYYTILSQNKVYIGDVDSNNFQTTDYNIYFKENIPSKISVPVAIIYKDTTNKVYNYNTNLDLNIYSTKEATQLGLIQSNNTVVIIVFIIIILIVIYIIYRIFRKRKQSSEN